MKIKIQKFEAARIEHKTFDNWDELSEYIVTCPLNPGSRMEIKAKKQKNITVYHVFIYKEL